MSKWAVPQEGFIILRELDSWPLGLLLFGQTTYFSCKRDFSCKAGSTVTAAGVMWIGGLTLGPPVNETSKQVNPSPSVFTANTPQPVTAARQPTRTIAESPIDSFRQKLMSIPESESLILSVQPSEVEGVARVQVTNVWFDARPHQKRQLTQLMANLWKSEMGDQPAILHIYDVTGREIAGTRAFGGVWIEDE